MTLRYSIDPADTDGGMAAAAIEREVDSFTTAARAEAERQYEVHTHPSWAGTNSALGFREGAEWARDHLAAQEPTDAEVEAAGEGMWNRYGDRGVWSHAPEHLRAAFRADARAALSAARAARTQS